MAKVITTQVANPVGATIKSSFGNVGQTRRNARVYNVVVILLDDVGLDKMDPAQWPEYAQPGVPNAATYAWLPSLRQLANEGILFKYAYVHPWCGPTRISLLTGRTTGEHGFGGNFNIGAPYPMPHPVSNASHHVGTPTPFRNGTIKEHTWANYLADTHPAGDVGVYYRVQVFGKWHLSGASSAFDCRQTIVNAHGFTRANIHQGNLGNDPMLSNPRDHFNFVTQQATQGSGPTLSTFRGPPYDESRWVSSYHANLLVTFVNQSTVPFVAYYAPNAPHAPHQVPPHSLVSSTTINNGRYTDAGYDNPLPAASGAVIDELAQPARAIQAYEASLEAIDSLIGAILYGNPTPGGTTSTQVSVPISSANLENTVVIVLGDNGTLREAVRWPYDPNHAKGDVYELGVRVPMIVRAPASLMPRGGLVCNRPVFVTDVFATIEELTRSGRYAHRSAANPRSGKSFLRLLGDVNGPPIRDTVTVDYFVPSGILGVTTYVFPQVSSITGASWDPATRRLTKAGAFTSYTFAEGDILRVTGGTGVTAGDYEIQSRIDANVIQLRGTISESAPSDVAGSVQRPSVLSEYITFYRGTIRPGSAKYMFKKEPDGSSKEFFFRLDLDPLELENLIDTEGGGSIENMSAENRTLAKELKAKTDTRWKL